MDFDKIKIYLPKYLSSDSENELFNQLKSFPSNIDHRIYTNYLKNQPVIFQGDCIKDLLVVQLPGAEVKKANCVVLSNTCDIDESNVRNFPSQIVYTPLIPLKKYETALRKKSVKSKEQLDAHLDSIRKQKITQIFYLPGIENVIEESIIFFDRLQNISNDYVKRAALSNLRLFSLSDYGIYLFLFKLSLHFTRMQDKVERRCD